MNRKKKDIMKTRTKKEILKVFQECVENRNLDDEANFRYSLLEVLIDIRDIMSKNSKKER